MNSLDNNEVLNEFLSGALDEALEGPAQAAEHWQHIASDPKLKAQYDASVEALRTLSGVQPTADGRAFCDAEADALWPLVWSGVIEDAKERSGLSRDALRHMAIPSMVESISRAIQNNEAGSLTVELPDVDTVQAMEVSIAKIDGQLSLRVYNNDQLDVHCATGKNDSATSNDEWKNVRDALRDLQEVTAQMLADDTWLHGRIEMRDGKAVLSLVREAIATGTK